MCIGRTASFTVMSLLFTLYAALGETILSSCGISPCKALQLISAPVSSPNLQTLLTLKSEVRRGSAEQTLLLMRVVFYLFHLFFSTEKFVESILYTFFSFACLHVCLLLVFLIGLSVVRYLCTSASLH